MSVRQRLIASPAGPAPRRTVSVVSMSVAPRPRRPRGCSELRSGADRSGGDGVDVERHRYAVGQDVVDGGALAGALDEPAQGRLGGVALDVEVAADAGVAV